MADTILDRVQAMRGRAEARAMEIRGRGVLGQFQGGTLLQGLKEGKLMNTMKARVDEMRSRMAGGKTTRAWRPFAKGPTAPPVERVGPGEEAAAVVSGGYRSFRK